MDANGEGGEKIRRYPPSHPIARHYMFLQRCGMGSASPVQRRGRWGRWACNRVLRVLPTFSSHMLSTSTRAIYSQQARRPGWTFPKTHFTYIHAHTNRLLRKLPTLPQRSHSTEMDNGTGLRCHVYKDIKTDPFNQCGEATRGFGGRGRSA